MVLGGYVVEDKVAQGVVDFCEQFLGGTGLDETPFGCGYRLGITGAGEVNNVIPPCVQCPIWQCHGGRDVDAHSVRSTCKMGIRSIVSLQTTFHICIRSPKQLTHEIFVFFERQHPKV